MECGGGGGGVTRIAMLGIGTVGFAQGEGGFSKLVSQRRRRPDWSGLREGEAAARRPRRVTAADTLRSREACECG